MSNTITIHDQAVIGTDREASELLIATLERALRHVHQDGSTADIYCNERKSGRGDADARVYHGKTLLIAAMRCFVSENLGEEVDVPDNLKGVQSESNPD